MKVISTNIAQPQFISWRGKQVKTGIFKKPINTPLHLKKEGVVNDEVSDLRVHGGINKACYLYGHNHYDHFKNLYPDLEWKYGMFGENITLEHLDESTINIGDIYKLGKTLVQVTQPREPCYKFGVKMGSLKVIKQFIDYAHSGVYIKVLEEGHVVINDELKLIEPAKHSLSIFDFFKLINAADKNQEHLKLAVQNEVIPINMRAMLMNFLS